MKKALHVRTYCCEGMMDWIHGGGRYIDRIYVPEERLMITLADGKAYATEGELLDEFTSQSSGGKELKPQIIGEMEVPEVLVSTARSLLLTQKGFKELVAQSWKKLPV